MGETGTTIAADRSVAPARACADRRARLLRRSITALDNDPQRALASNRAQRDTPHMPDVLLFP